jgi:hypothetical protein
MSSCPGSSAFSPPCVERLQYIGSEAQARSHNLVRGGIGSVASGPSPATVTAAHAADTGSSTTDKLNGDSPNLRARSRPTLITAACAVPSAKRATTSVERPRSPRPRTRNHEHPAAAQQHGERRIARAAGLACRSRGYRGRAARDRIGGVDTGLELTVKGRQVGAELDMLAAHPQASTPNERRRAVNGAGNEVIWALAHSADGKFGLDEPTPVGPLGPWSVVLEVAGWQPPASSQRGSRTASARAPKNASDPLRTTVSTTRAATTVRRYRRQRTSRGPSTR